ncbi:MAG: Hpt domain-containing protein [Eubacteriales bacterium]|nr:Hpt domain-containing protein [Eubacteriales bacterium]
MTLKEFYTSVGGSYDDVMNRLRMEKLVYKFLFKFPAATDYSDLVNAVNNAEWPDAFRFSHNLKGVGLNLSLDKMAQAASVLCEEIRNGPPSVDVAPMMRDITAEYDHVISQINLLKESVEA